MINPKKSRHYPTIYLFINPFVILSVRQITWLLHKLPSIHAFVNYKNEENLHLNFVELQESGESAEDGELKNLFLGLCDGVNTISHILLWAPQQLIMV